MLFKLIIINLFFVFLINLHASDKKNSKENSLLLEIEKIAKKHTGVLLGVDIVEYVTGKNVVSLNSDLPLNPASVIKIVTAASALDNLRPEYTFKTRILTDGNVKESKLTGNIYIQSGGDPLFVTEHMYLLADYFSRQNFKKISGNLIFDTSFFIMAENENETGFSSNRPYNAITAPLSFNFNTTNIYINPGEKIGDPLNVFIDPENSYVRVINSTSTSRREFTLQIGKSSPINEGEIFKISGLVPYNTRERIFRIPVLNPNKYFAQVLRDFLLKKGVVIEGNITNGNVPEKARMIFTHESRPLGFVVKDLFTYSNNVIPENIVRTMGQHNNASASSETTGLEIIKQYFKKSGVAVSEITLHKASGLSRINRMSARSINKVMITAFSDFTIAPELLNAFCVSGTTGTLKDRFNGKFKEKIRAKTGSLSGVSSLAGIYSGKNNTNYIFTIIANANDGRDLINLVDRVMIKVGEKL